MTTTPTPTQPPLSAGAVPELPVVAWRDPHAHWIQSADGLASWNPAPDASPAAVPSTVTVTLKVGNEFARYHPQASHVPPDHRDGWNRCFDSAQATIAAQAAVIERLKDDNAICRDAIAHALQLVENFADSPEGDDDMSQGAARATRRQLNEAIGKMEPRLMMERELSPKYGLRWKELHAELESLKAKQVADVEAVMRLADKMARAAFDRKHITLRQASREALRSHLTKDRT